MLSFRYHVTSLVAVFLALAAGIALGGGPLHDVGRDHSGEELASARAALDTQRSHAADLRRQADLADEFAGAAGPRLVAGKLSGHTVSLVVLPGADPGVVSRLTSLLGRAGARLGGTFTVQPKTTQSANRQLVDALTSQLAAQEKQVSVPAAASTYQRLGVLMGRLAGSTTKGGASYDATAVSILAGLDTAGLVTAKSRPQERGDVVVLVAGSPQSEADTEAAPAIEDAMAGAMAGTVRGVVVAGPTASATHAGVVQVVRSGSSAKKVTTVDSVDTGPGLVATVLAAAGAAAGQHGAYGIVGDVSGPMPGVAGSRSGTS
ncbi:MAG TPA: copper transporter [Marmoricola sp.]|nr:copper transporter [Marmoricola sp.]